MMVHSVNPTWDGGGTNNVCEGEEGTGVDLLVDIGVVAVGSTLMRSMLGGLRVKNKQTNFSRVALTKKCSVGEGN